MTEATKALIRGIAEAIIDEASVNEEFSNKIEDILSGNAGELSGDRPKKKGKKGGRAANRRDPAVLDPIALITEDEAELVVKLQGLTDKELKDIIADYGMDPSKLAMKWKDKERLINHIIDASKRRAFKGDAFRDANEG